MLKPTPLSRQIFLFCLAHAARIYKVKIHAYCLMSNHYHLVLTDVLGNLPAFMSWFNEFVAKAMNTTLGRCENFWAAGTYSAVRLETFDDVMDKIVYTLANPVASLLVAKSQNWPGATSRNIPFNVEKSHKRPHIFFRKNGPLPESEPLTLEIPDGFEGSAKDFKTVLNQLLAEKEQEISDDARRQKRPFMGAARAVAVNLYDKPAKPEAKRNLNPHVASKHRHALINALRRIKWFRNQYAAARKLFDQGDTDVVFPFGTYALQKLVQVQPIPPPDIDIAF